VQLSAVLSVRSSVMHEITEQSTRTSGYDVTTVGTI
jgi:hypothetical protein